METETTASEPGTIMRSKDKFDETVEGNQLAGSSSAVSTVNSRQQAQETLK